MPRLILTSGPLVGRRYEIDRELVIGRRDATLTIPDDQASPRHAALRMVDGELEVEDLGSSDGTWVDGERIEGPVILGDGATLCVGATTFIVEIDAWTSERGRTNPHLATLAHPPLADVKADPVLVPYAAPSHDRRRRADTRMWMPAAATFATIIVTAIALVIYFALR
jgi:pSer/pThr/pTyr-binding forkhead associated (FHA) protein